MTLLSEFLICCGPAEVDDGTFLVRPITSPKFGVRRVCRRPHQPAVLRLLERHQVRSLIRPRLETQTGCGAAV